MRWSRAISSDDLEPLALAQARVVGSAEDRGDVVPRRLVGGDDPDVLLGDRVHVAIMPSAVG